MIFCLVGILAVVVGLLAGSFMTMTMPLFLFVLIASVVLGVGGAIAGAFYWKHNPRGYVYGPLGRRRRSSRWFF